MNKRFADQWYEILPINDGISLIRETHVAPWLRCNMWHIRGRTHDLLIDTGMGVKPLKSEVTQLLERPVKVISTHAHFDHIGGAHEFECRLGHRSEAHIHQSPTEKNTSGWNAFVRAETFLMVPDESFSFEQYFVKSAPLTGYIDEGDVIDLDNRHFEIFHLPGHSPGSIVLFDRASATLFSGDVIYDGDLFDTVYHSDREQYRDSLNRLKELPVQTIHGGHFESFGRDRMLERIDAYLRGEGRIENAEDWVSQRC
ncbi:MAG: MBL fold metallo-hydrolase [Pseudomonadota bacterium]